MIAIIGAGGHARVVVDALFTRGVSSDDIVMTDRQSIGTKSIHGIAVVSPEFHSSVAGRSVHVAIGDNPTRIRLIQDARSRGHPVIGIVHRTAVISPYAHLSDGVFVAALAIVGPGANIGEGAIVNHGAIVDHDCVVGGGAHVAPGAVLGGGASVGEGAMVGANAAILPGCSVGAGAIVGSGAVVTANVAPGTTVVGVPARAK